MITKRAWMMSSGLFLLPFGLVISLSYLFYAFLFFEKPTFADDSHDLTRHSVHRIKKGVDF